MTDLDIQIDVPDDDDLDSSVRVLNGDSIPPWLKAAAVLILGGLAAITIGAFLLGRSSDEVDPVTAPTVVTTPIASATASPAIENSLEAVQTWEAFARTGELAGVDETFDPAGPQYAMFRELGAPGGSSEVDFAARNLTEVNDGDVTTVSMELLVSGPTGQESYPFDMIYLGDSPRVWTVIDRRAPGTVALPPSSGDIEAARRSWAGFTSSMSVGDGAAVTEVVSADSRVLAEQVTAAAAGADVDGIVLDDRQLFDLLVARVQRASVAEPGQAIVALLDEDQRQALLFGELTSWTQVGTGRMVASLEVAGQPVATVPFVAVAEGWAFDLKAALEAGGGGDR